jgi:hypothetical protein
MAGHDPAIWLIGQKFEWRVAGFRHAIRFELPSFDLFLG